MTLLAHTSHKDLFAEFYRKKLARRWVGGWACERAGGWVVRASPCVDPSQNFTARRWCACGGCFVGA